VAGAKAGSAYESLQPNASHTPRLGRDHLPPLVGSLMLDTAQRYFFVPSSYPVAKVTPGEMSEDHCASVEYGGSTYRNCKTSGSAGGFWIVAICELGNHVQSLLNFVHKNASRVLKNRDNAQKREAG
jgi:hypothetical protein